VLHADNKAGDPGNATTGVGLGDRFDTRGTLTAVGVEHDHGWTKGSLRVYSNDGQSVQQPGLTSRFSLSGARWREALRPWSGGELVAGLDIERIAGEVSPVGFTATDMKVTSPYVAVNHTAALGQGWTITPSAGLRVYRHNQLSSATAPHAGVVVSSADQWAFRAQVSKGVNYPGLDAQVLGHLIPALGTTWKTLGAEKLNHKEVGVSWTPSARTTLDVSVFHDSLSGRYVFAFPPAVTAPTFVNLGDYSVKGAELSLQQELAAGWNAFVGATHLSASKADLPYAPSSSLTLGVNGQVGAWRLGMDAQRQSSMFVLAQARASGAPNLSQVAGFTVVNARVGYKLPALGERGEVFLAAENLLDRQYEFRPGYPMAGRSFQVGLHANF
jgi:iron complex outermembrane recepter protein